MNSCKARSIEIVSASLYKYFQLTLKVASSPGHLHELSEEEAWYHSYLGITRWT